MQHPASCKKAEITSYCLNGSGYACCISCNDNGTNDNHDSKRVAWTVSRSTWEKQTTDINMKTSERSDEDDDTNGESDKSLAIKRCYNGGDESDKSYNCFVLDCIR